MRQSLAPILIASPVVRSGTTLLQRLLCSAPNALIFGENSAHDLNLFLGLWQNKQMVIRQDQTWRNAQLEKVLSGEVNDWIADLLPDPQDYLTQYEKTVFQFIGYFGKYAAERGRPVWGMKLAGWPPMYLKMVLEQLPASRLIYIVRDLKSCVRSAKLIDQCETLEDIRAFVQMGQQNQAVVANWATHQRVLLIAYEELIARPDLFLPQIEAFSGAQPIQRAVMQHRINSYDQVALTPPKLTPEESRILDSMI